MPPTVNDVLVRLGLTAEIASRGVAIGREFRRGGGGIITSRSPIDGQPLLKVSSATAEDADRAIAAAADAFLKWRMTPAPVRGEFVRRVGDRLRELKPDLAELITLEAGKITQEALGEVQEMIDICDFAVGLSRQLYGLIIASERPQHRLMEQWHPLGPIGVITAFNFPVAVWAWNAMLAWVCGDPVIWKPSEKTPLCAIACHTAVQGVLREMPDVPEGVASLLIGGRQVSGMIVDDPRVPLVSATGSVAMGKAIAPRIAARFGRALLELGGNNGMIVAPTADTELAVRSIVFGAVGTCGQRCTTLRRLIVHESCCDQIVGRLKAVYASLPVGDPSQPGTLVGPLIDEPAFNAMQVALARSKAERGTVHFGERITAGLPPGGFYVRPALVEIPDAAAIVREETFAPILYVMRYTSFEDAIRIHNGVPQGLSSAILTNDLREAERFTAAAGSDCGIVNVNAGTSGAEIGGAFGGEKDTGGGRESGSDAWKNYMRRMTSAINWSTDLPLAQGIRFDV